MGFIKEKQIIKKLFLVFMIAFFLGSMYINLYPLISNNYFTRDVCFYLFIIIFIIILFYMIIKSIDLNTKKTILCISIILLLGIIARIISIYLFKTEQVSDFQNAEKLYKFLLENKFQYQSNPLNNTSLQNNFSLFPTWTLYCYLMFVLYNIFGFTTAFVKYMNIILYVISTIFIYIGAKNFYTKKIGLLSIFIFSLAPTLIIYNNVATPDHFTILFMSIVIYIWSLLLKYSNTKTKYILSIFLIINMVLINMFKPLSIYMLLVFICSEVISLFTKKEAKAFKKNWKYYLFFIITFICINSGANYILNNSVEKLIKLSVKDSSSMYMLWGYSLNEEGIYDSNYIYTPKMAELSKKYQNDYNLILKDLDKIASDNLKQNVKYLPKIWIAKFRIAFNNEMDYFSFANTSKDSEIISNKYYNKVCLITNSFMALNYLMIVLFCIYEYRNKIFEKKSYIILLMIMGYLAILILGGVQSRYKSLISPQFFILYALGIDYLLRKLNINFIKIKKGVKIDVSFSNNTSV